MTCRVKGAMRICLTTKGEGLKSGKKSESENKRSEIKKRLSRMWGYWGKGVVLIKFY